MDCRRVIELLPDYSVELLDGRTQGAVAGHLAGCAHCRTEMAAMEHALSLVERYASLEPPPALWNGVANRLTGEAERPLPRSPWGWLFARPARALTAAAVGLAVFAALALFPGTPNVSPPGSDHVVIGSRDAELSALLRQHALIQAEAPLSERAMWEVEAGPATTSDDQAEVGSRL